MYMICVMMEAINAIKMAHDLGMNWFMNARCSKFMKFMNLKSFSWEGPSPTNCTARQDIVLFSCLGNISL
jgi:hypothetical protein